MVTLRFYITPLGAAPLIVKQSLSRIFIKLRHFRHLFYILMFLKLQPPTMHDCEILTSHGGDSHDNHDYPSAGLSRHGCYTLTASNSDALGPVKSCCRAWNSNARINTFLSLWLAWVLHWFIKVCSSKLQSFILLLICFLVDKVFLNVTIIILAQFVNK